MRISHKSASRVHEACGAVIGAVAVTGGCTAAVALFPMTSLPVFVFGVVAVAVTGLLVAVVTTVRRGRPTFRLVDWVLTSLALATNLTAFWSVTFYLSLCFVTGAALVARAVLRAQIHRVPNEHVIA